jgi:hypothetical protein
LRPYLEKANTKNRTDRVVQVAEHLHRKHEDLSSNSSTSKKKKYTERERERERERAQETHRTLINTKSKKNISNCFLRYWGLNSRPPPQGIPTALFCDGIFFPR